MMCRRSSDHNSSTFSSNRQANNVLQNYYIISHNPSLHITNTTSIGGYYHMIHMCQFCSVLESLHFGQLFLGLNITGLALTTNETITSVRN